MMGVCRDLAGYFTRPIIPFCFGIPLLLPASLLVAVAFLQKDPMTSLRVLGIVLLVLSVASISFGTVLGFYDRRKVRNFKGGKKQPLIVREATPREQKTRFSSPTLSASGSRSSSKSSVTSESSISFVVTNEKARLYPMANKKRRKNRLRNVVFPTKKLPSLQEEDSKSSLGSDLPPNIRSAENLKKLEEYLKSLGLGGKDKNMAKPSAAVSGAGNKSAKMDLLKVKQDAEFLRSKSLPEGAFQDLVQNQTEVNGGTSSAAVRLQRSARSPREMKRPRLVSDSHEPVGVRMDIGNVTASFQM